MSDENVTQSRQGSSQSAPNHNTPRDGKGPSTSQTSAASASSAKPRIGDSRPAPVESDASSGNQAGNGAERGSGGGEGGRRRRGGGSGSGQQANQQRNQKGQTSDSSSTPGEGQKRRRRRGGRGRGGNQGGNNQGNGAQPVTALTGDAVELDEETLALRKGRERKGKPAGRYLMCVSVRPEATQIAVVEGRSLIEHYVSRPADDVAQIHGNIYLGKVQNVLPGMEAAFVDITTPKNAVLYRGDVAIDKGDAKSSNAKIEQILKPKQNILCQVTKNPIATRVPVLPRKSRFRDVSSCWCQTAMRTAFRSACPTRSGNAFVRSSIV